MNEKYNASWWVSQGKILSELEDRVYFISSSVLINFWEKHEIYKIFLKIIDYLGALRNELDITIIDYFPNQSDYLGNIRNLFMFGGPKNMESYKKSIYNIKDTKIDKNYLTTQEINFIVKFLKDLENYISLTKNCEVIFGMPRQRFEKTNHILEELHKNISKFYLHENSLKFQ